MKKHTSPRPGPETGEYLINQGKINEAVAVFSRAAAEAPKSFEGHNRLGIALSLAGRYREAVRAFEKAILLNPSHPGLKVNQARAMVRAGEGEKALVLLDTLGSEGRRARAGEIRVEALVSLGRFREAEVGARALLEAYSSTPRLLTLCALVSAGQDRHKEAIYYLQQALAAEPGNPRILGELAGQYTALGHFTEGAQVLKQALEHEPKAPNLWGGLARIYLQGGHLAAADKAADRALDLTETAPENGKGGNGEWVSGERARAFSVKGDVAAEREDGPGAKAAYESALALDPDCIPALLGLGSLYVSDGEIPRAVGQFERAAALAPLAGEPALMRLRKFPEDPAVLERIEAAARQPGMAGSVKAHLLFGLAMAWETRQEYKKAFSLAATANAVNRKKLNYQREENREEVRQVISCCTRRFFKARQGFGHPSRRPVFVLGMPRSGTTLVEQILASHPQVFGAGELGHIPGWCKTLEMLRGRAFYPDCLTRLTRRQVLRIASFCLEHLKALSSSAAHIIDKLPHNFVNIGFIHLLFPAAAVIHCVRDERDVALSNFFIDFKAKFGGMGYAYDLGDLGHHMADYRAVTTHWHRVLPGRILDVRYEDLVNDPRGEAQRMVRHLGLEWRPEILEFSRLKRPVKTASAWQVRQPLYKSSKGRWRHFEEELAPFAAAFEDGRADWSHWQLKEKGGAKPSAPVLMHSYP